MYLWFVWKFFFLNKQNRTCRNAASNGISSGITVCKGTLYGFSLYKGFSSYEKIKTLIDYEQEFPHTPITRGIMRKRHKSTGLEVMNLSIVSFSKKKKCNDWLLADTCPQAANHCALF